MKNKNRARRKSRKLRPWQDIYAEVKKTGMLLGKRLRLVYDSEDSGDIYLPDLYYKIYWGNRLIFREYATWCTEEKAEKLFDYLIKNGINPSNVDTQERLIELLIRKERKIAERKRNKINLIVQKIKTVLAPSELKVLRIEELLERTEHALYFLGVKK